MLRIGKLSSQRTKVISISEAGRRQSRQHAPELESVVAVLLFCMNKTSYDIIQFVVSGRNCRFDHEQEACAEGFMGSVS